MGAIRVGPIDGPAAALIGPLVDICGRMRA